MSQATQAIKTLEDISLTGQVRLMEMAYSRLRFGVSAMPFIALLYIWYHSLHSAVRSVALWAILYWLLFAVSLVLYRVYQRDLSQMSPQNALQKWTPRIHALAITHGCLLTLFMILVRDTATLELKYLYTLTVAAIIAGNATHQSPMISVFRRFLLFGWHLNVLAMPWTFKDHWQFIMPLSAIYSIGMHKYSLASHRFFLQLVWLEEESNRLKEQYKYAKDEAENALQAKNQFLTTASHDLRQPVHAMGFLIESILQRNKDSAIAPALNDLKLSVRSVTQMFNSLLDLSKIESGTTQLNAGTIFLDDLIEDIARVYAEEARARKLELRVHLGRRHAVAHADGNLLRQSLMNLIHNALRYTRQGGVLIGYRKRGGQWQVEVWDTGIGLAIADQQQIFSPFFRNDHAWQIDSAGHGLGLAVVARCCKLMGSQYGLTSKLGQGSRFWLRVPAITDKLKSLRIVNLQDTPNPQPNMALSGACLIIDDDPQVCSAWELLLSTWGLQVVCAGDATEALKVLGDGFIPQVILCDQRLRAGESGFDLLRALLERYPDARGAMVSGEFNSPELRQAEDEGYLVLRKPVEPKMLHALLAQILK